MSAEFRVLAERDPSSGPGRSGRSPLVALAALVAVAALAIPANFEARGNPPPFRVKPFRDAKERFNNQWRPARKNYDPLAEGAQGLVTACKEAESIADLTAKQAAFAYLGQAASVERKIFNDWRNYRDVLDDRALAIRRSADGLRPPLWGVRVIHGVHILRDAVDLLTGDLGAGGYLVRVADRVAGKNCSGADFAAAKADDAYGQAITKKLRAFRLFIKP